MTEVTEVPDGFVGKNAIVWRGDGKFDEFLVQSVDDHLITANRVLDVQGLCHFTLDSAPTLDSCDDPCNDVQNQLRNEEYEDINECSQLPTVALQQVVNTEKRCNVSCDFLHCHASPKSAQQCLNENCVYCCDM